MAPKANLILTIVSCATFVLGFIFAIIGYTTFWIIPRKEYRNEPSRIDGVGLRKACFVNFRFPSYVKVTTIFNDCRDNSRYSAVFEGIPPDVWSPRFFQVVQDMHLGSIALCVILMLVMAGYASAMFYANYRATHRKKPFTWLNITKCCLALWFVLSFVLGLMLIAEPVIFYANFREDHHFYYTQKPYDVSIGFGITLGAGFLFLICGGLGLAMFIGIIRKLARKAFHPEQQDEKKADTEMHKLAAGETTPSASRKDPDGIDQPIVVEKYQAEPDNKRPLSQPPVYDQSEVQVRPVPKPRSVSSRDISRESSVARPEVNSQFAGTPRDQSPERQSVYSKASRRSVDPQQFKYDFQPGYGYVPKSARPASEQGGPRSAQIAPQGQPPAGSPYYYAPSQKSYAGSIASDNDSVRTDRNRSTVGSVSMSPNAKEAVPQSKVITPKDSSNPKHSRYAAGW